MSETAQVTITIRENGSYRVEGPVKLLDHNGNEITLRQPPFSLCRCGHSKNKPFCDSTHREIGFDGTLQALQKEAEKNG